MAETLRGRTVESVRIWDTPTRTAVATVARICICMGYYTIQRLNRGGIVRTWCTCVNRLLAGDLAIDILVRSPQSTNA